MKNIDILYFINGLIILLVGLIGGFPFASAIKNQNGKETAWRVVHSGSSMAGIMLMVIGAMIYRFEITAIANQIIFWGIIVSTYIFVIGMVLAAITGQRGIGNVGGKSSSWKFVYYMYGIAAATTIVFIVMLLILSLKHYL